MPSGANPLTNPFLITIFYTLIADLNNHLAIDRNAVGAVHSGLTKS